MSIVFIWVFPKIPVSAQRVASGGMIRGMIRPRSSHNLFLKGPTKPWHTKVRFRYDSGYASGMIRGMIRACNCFLKKKMCQILSKNAHFVY